ncbi:DUF6328 family protein [Streptomyces sp. NPDC001985]|uniref:DUF6328 family protein n=1 Tax=Streptomyces sp. NPDC001985 TaxID=3154406 RepID=UPI003332C0A4
MTLTDRPAPAAGDHRCGHGSHRGPDSAGADDGEESPQERVNRRWNEILQETRVAQTGVQILFGFLLSIAFTASFRELETPGRALYVLTVALGASATASLIAPVSIHRFLSGQQMKDEVVRTAGRLVVCGMVLLALTIGCTLLLILNVVLTGPLATAIAAVVMLWFALCWYVLPFRLRRQGKENGNTGG